jgi:hypothetical protein
MKRVSLRLVLACSHSPMPAPKRPKAEKSHSEPTPGPSSQTGAASTLQGATLTSEKYKIPLISYILGRSRLKKLSRGAEVLSEVNRVFKEIRKRLDDTVKEDFEKRLGEYVTRSIDDHFAAHLVTVRLRWSTRCAQSPTGVSSPDLYTSTSSIPTGWNTQRASSW